MDTAKETKSKFAEKAPTSFFSVSAVVLTYSVSNFGGLGLKMQVCAENTIKIVVSAKNKPPKMTKHCPNLKVTNGSKSKIGPSMLRNIIGPVFDL